MVMEKNFKTFARCSLKIVTSYIIALVIFAIFIMIILNFAKHNVGGWVSAYSFVVFLIMFSMIYNDMKDTAFKEKRPQYNINPSPYKGILYGLAGMLPILLPILVYPFIQVNDSLITLKLRIIQGYTAPFYWFTRLFGDAYWSYIVSLFLLPLSSMLGYLSGHFNVEIFSKIKAPIKSFFSRFKTEDD